MTTFDKAGTFLDCGQAVDYDGVYLLQMDFQSLVMNLLAFIMLSSRAHYIDGALYERARNLFQDQTTFVP